MVFLVIETWNRHRRLKKRANLCWIPTYNIEKEKEIFNQINVNSPNRTPKITPATTDGTEAVCKGGTARKKTNFQLKSTSFCWYKFIWLTFFIISIDPQSGYKNSNQISQNIGLHGYFCEELRSIKDEKKKYSIFKCASNWFKTYQSKWWW